MTDTINRNGLEVTEYVSVAGSVAGTVVAVFTQQLIYAAAPLSLALSLSLINRRRVEQTLQETMTTVLSEMNTRVRQIDQELSGEMRGLKASVKDLSFSPQSVDLQPIQSEISQMQKRFDTLEKAIGEISVSTRQDNSHLPIDQSEQSTQASANFDPSYLEEQIAALKAEIQQQPSVAPDADTSNNLEEQIQQLQINLASITETFNVRLDEVRQITTEVQSHLGSDAPPVSPVESSKLEQQIQELKASLSQTEKSTRTSLSQLEQQNQQLQASLKGLADSLNKGLQPSDQTEQLKPVSSVELVPVAELPANFNSSYLEQQIKQLKQEVQFLHHQIADVDVSSLSKAEEIKPFYARLNDVLNNAAEYSVTKLEELVKCIRQAPQQFFQQQDKKEEEQEEAALFNFDEIIGSEATEDENSLPAESSKEAVEQANEIASLQAELSDELKLASATSEIETPSSEDIEASLDPSEQFNSSAEKKTISIEKLMEMAENEGIGAEFRMVMETGQKHNLILNAWPTNLMISPPINLMSAGKRNSSQCLLIISAQATKEGKTLVWISSQVFAEFYSLRKDLVGSKLGNDGWHEMDKAQIEEFVASLERLFELANVG